MKMFYLTRTSLYLMITLLLCFALHIPVATSLAESPPPKKDKPQYVIRLGTLLPAGVSYMKYAEKNAREIEALTDYRLKFELYPGGMLGDEPTMVKMVRKGELDSAIVSSYSLEEVFPEILVLSLPGLFRDEFELDFILKKYEPLLTRYARERGIEILSLNSVGCSPMYSTVPISGPHELNEKKIMRLDNTIGWDLSIPLSLSEVETALSSGKVEVVFGPPALAVVMGWYPYIRYVYMACFSPMIGVVIANAGLYGNIPDDIGSVLKELIPRQQEPNFKLARRDNEIAMLGLMKRGVKIIRWSPEDMAKVLENAKSLWDFGAGKWYPRKLLDDIVRDLEEYRAGQVEIAPEN